MDAGNYVSIIAAVIAALSAWAVSRSSAKANQLSKQLEAQAAVDSEKIRTDGVKETTRASAETEAYERARAFDVATIERQAAEIMQVRADNIHLNADVKRVNREIQDLYAEREALHNEIRNMHEERAQERQECQKVRQRLAHAIAEGRIDPEHAADLDIHVDEIHDGYTEPGDNYPDQN
jgi:regulator of replication initiation timing